MIDNIHLSRIRSNFLRTTSNLMNIWDTIEMIAKKSSEGDVDQNMLDEFKNILDTYDASQEILKNALQTLLIDILKGESDSVDALETENGFEL